MSIKDDLELVQLNLNGDSNGTKEQPAQHPTSPPGTAGKSTSGGGDVGISRDVVDGLTRQKPTFKEIASETDASTKEKGINCRKCVRFVKREGSEASRGDQLCCCGYPKSKHDADSGTTSLEGWNLKTDTQCVPTNAAGEMEFIGFSQKYAKYVRVDVDTDMDVLWDMMTRVWKLRPPHLVISVTGGARYFELTTRLKEVFRKGLIRAALCTDAWITSGGTHAGIMKYVGEAVRDLTVGQTSQNKVVALGIAPWGCVHNKDSLIDSKGLVQYRIEDCKNPGETAIDCNHTHFVLVDDGTQHKFAMEIPLRTRLEKTIAEKSSGNGLTIPIILVVVEGGPGTLETVYSSIENKTPALIIAGSGRAADVLAYAFSKAVEHKFKCADQQGLQIIKNILIMPNEIEDDVTHQLQKTFKITNEEKLNTYVDWIKQCLQYPDLLSVFQLDSQDSAKEIDLAILKGLLKANREHVLEQLRLALIWNRVDVAKSDIFTEDRTWESGSLIEVMLTAIRLDRVDFVNLFLENGLSLREFLTEETLLELYNTVPKKSILYVLLRDIFNKKRSVPSSCTLLQVGRLIKMLMGDFYDPVYLRPDSRQDQTGNKIPREHPARDLFMLCILMDRCDMAKVFWEQGKDSLPAALVANSLLKSMQHKTKDVEVKEKLAADALEFQQLALGIIKTCYEDDEDKTHGLLVRRLSLWGNTNCVSIAIQAENKEFIAQAACQDLFNEIWWGRLEHSNGYMVGILEQVDTITDKWQLLDSDTLVQQSTATDCATVVHQDTVMPTAIFPPLMFFCLGFKTPTDEFSNADTANKRPSLAHQDTPSPLWHEESCLFSWISADGKRYVNGYLQTYLKRYVEVMENLWNTVNKLTQDLIRNNIFFVAFLLLYSYIMLTDFYYRYPSIPEYVLIAWVFTMFLEEVRQLWKVSPGTVWTRMKHYVQDKWNILDVVTISVFFVGVVLRFLPSTDAFEAARLILAVNLFTFFVRLLHIFSVSKLMGPKLVMIGKMIWDLVSFLVIMLVFIIGYAIMSQSILYPNTVLQPTIIIDVLRKAYWQMFAELFLEEIEGKEDCVDDMSLYSNGTFTRCPSETGKVMVPILLAFYMLLTNILLLNLLIAMFSNTFQAIQDNTDLHWHFQRYKLVYEYFERPVLPPPFIIVSHIHRLVKLCMRCESRVSFGFLPGKDAKAEEARQLDLFEEDRRDEFVWQRNQTTRETTNYKVSNTAERIETLVAKVDDIQGHILTTSSRHPSLSELDGAISVEGVLTDIQDRVDNLEHQMTRTYEALEWVMSALTDNNMTPNAAQKPTRYTSVKEGPIKRDHGSAYKKASSKRRLKRQSTIDTNSMTHTKARSSPYPGTELHRFEVRTEQVPWSVTFSGYKPPRYTSKEVLVSSDWSDVESLKKGYAWNQNDDKTGIDRTSHMGIYTLTNGCPVNPAGRTGLTGRGNLGRWGPNHAADAIITRWKHNEMGEAEIIDGSRVLEFVAVKRHDNKKWCLPGVFALAKEEFSITVQRAFVEEALANVMGNLEPKIRKLLSKDQEVYKGYVDDDRNTDNAWVETRAVNYHDEDGSITKGMTLMSIYMGIVLYGPAIALDAVASFPMWASIMIVGLSSVIYTSVGGFKAVIWTDVFQMAIMVIGLVAILTKSLIDIESIREFWSYNVEGKRIRKVEFNPDPTIRTSFWAVFIGFTYTWFALSFNQQAVQRMVSMPTQSKARRVLLGSVPGFYLLSILAILEGFAAYAYYSAKRCDPFEEGVISNSNEILPYFVMELFHELPGFPGIFLAALFSASLSTLSSGLNSLSAITLNDFIKPFWPKLKDSKATLVAKGLVFAFGLISVGISFLIMNIGGPITQITGSLMGSLSGPNSGLFLLGAFFPWANVQGVIWGAVSGVVIIFWIALGSNSIKVPWLPPAPTDQCNVTGLLNVTSHIHVWQNETQREDAIIWTDTPYNGQPMSSV